MYYCDDCLEPYPPYDGWQDCALCEDCRDRLAEQLARDEEDGDDAA